MGFIRPDAPFIFLSRSAVGRTKYGTAPRVRTFSKKRAHTYHTIGTIFSTRQPLPQHGSTLYYCRVQIESDCSGRHRMLVLRPCSQAGGQPQTKQQPTEYDAFTNPTVTPGIARYVQGGAEGTSSWGLRNGKTYVSSLCTSKEKSYPLHPDASIHCCLKPGARLRWPAHYNCGSCDTTAIIIACNSPCWSCRRC